ncbi:hypothetical protein SFUMM280S_02941 [Streptomyces fumanus]
MPHVVLQARTDALDPAEAYRRISDFRRYPEFTDTVREVTVEPPLADGSAISEWAVVFRGGLMRWRERDTFDPDTRTIAFEQLSGDFKTFTGSWRCAPRDGGTLVVFDGHLRPGHPQPRRDPRPGRRGHAAHPHRADRDRPARRRGGDRWARGCGS